MCFPDFISAVASRWFDASATDVEPLRTTGFSGSPVLAIRVPATGERFVMKSFPGAASPEHARWVHGLVSHLRSAGLIEVPEVIASRDGDTVAEDASGRLWELTRFMPGAAVTAPTLPQAGAAAAWLARMHRVAAHLPGASVREGVPPAVARRIVQGRALLESPWRLAAAHRGAAERVLERFEEAIRLWSSCGAEPLLRRLVAVEPNRVPLQACLRDIWHAHVFFARPHDEAITAVIDLHAAAIDTPATDVARLLGSWIAVPGREGAALGARWREALAGYEAVRPLHPVERTLLPLLHATGVILGLDNWFRWILRERRLFPDTESTLARIDALLRELPVAVAAALHAADNDD